MLNMKQLIIIDCQNDFITGTLACHDAPEAVEHIIDYLNEHEDVEVFYSQDWHSPTNGSFEVNGGIWPIHCVANTDGSALSDEFSKKLKYEHHMPSVNNSYLKGKDDLIEEYSAFYATNKDGKVLFEQLNDKVLIAGIASEYCVLETIKELRKRDTKVTALKKGLGYVDPKTHKKALKEYKELGVKIK